MCEKKNVPDEANSKGTNSSLRMYLEHFRKSKEVNKQNYKVKKRYLARKGEHTTGKAF